jgi:tetratricopeptide (TPR) repeat protein
MKHAVQFLLPAPALLFSLAVWPAANVRAQAPGAAGSQTTPGPSSGRTNNGVGTPGQINSTPTINGDRTNGNFNQPNLVSGKVVMDDGSPVPPNVTIQRVCGGMVHSVAYTDSKGHFSFQWGQMNPGMLADASEAGSGSRLSTNGGFGGSQSAGGSNPLGVDPFNNRMMNCELRANLAGYRSDNVNMFRGSALENPDVGSIFLHRMAGVEGSSVSATSFLAPKDARKAYEKGLQSLLKNKPDDAAKDFEKAVAAYPKYADAWMNLGKARLQQKSYDPAKEALMKALDADAKLVGPYVELGLLSAQQQQWEDSARYLDRAVKLDPVDFPQAWYADAVADYNLKRYDAAEVSAREAIKLDPKHVNARADYLLAMVLIEKKSYAGAAASLKTFMKLAPNAPEFEKVKEQLGQLEKFMLESQKEAGKQP